MKKTSLLKAMLRPLKVVICIVLAMTAMASTITAAEPYRLGSADRLSIRVIDWEDAESTVNRWSAVSGEYAIGPDGAVAFPFMAPLLAVGKSPVELAKELRSALRLSLGLSNPPDVTIEVVNFGSVFVTGDVSQPGAYPFTPSLTVLQAISLAGGIRRADASRGGGRDLISLQGTYNLLREQRVRLMVRIARLDALLNGSTEIMPPAELEAASIKELVAAEVAELKAQLQQADSRVATYAAQENLIDATLLALERKRAVAETQLAQLRIQLEKIQGLVDSGLAVETRVSATESAIADLESRLLDLETAKLRAEQDKGNVILAREAVSSDRFLQASRDRRQLDADLSDIEVRLATQLQLIGDTATLDDLPNGDFNVLTYRYTIVRGGVEIGATRNDVVRPGDVVTVGISASGDEAAL